MVALGSLVVVAYLTSTRQARDGQGNERMWVIRSEIVRGTEGESKRRNLKERRGRDWGKR